MMMMIIIMVPNAKATAQRFSEQLSATVHDELLPASMMERIKTHMA